MEIIQGFTLFFMGILFKAIFSQLLMKNTILGSIGPSSDWRIQPIGGLPATPPTMRSRLGPINPTLQCQNLLSDWSILWDHGSGQLTRRKGASLIGPFYSPSRYSRQFLQPWVRGLIR